MSARPLIVNCQLSIVNYLGSASAAVVVVTAAGADDENKKNNPAATVSAETIVTHMSFLLSSTLHNIKKEKLCYRVLEAFQQSYFFGVAL